MYKLVSALLSNFGSIEIPFHKDIINGYLYIRCTNEDAINLNNIDIC